MRNVRLPVPAGAVTVAVLLVATAVAAGFATLDTRVVYRPLRQPAVPPTPPPPRAVAPAEASGSDGSWLAGLAPLLVLVLLVVVAGAGLLGWVLLRRSLRRAGRRRYRLRRLRPATATGSPPEPLDEERLRAAVDEAVARFEDDDDPRRAVIACWVGLAEAAGEAGIPRHRSDTATDLVVRLLRRQQVSEPVLGAFVAAYWLARYTTHPVDEQMRTQARSALRRLRAELVTGVPAG